MISPQQEHDDFPAAEGYRSLSTAAVTSAVLGVLSPLVFAGPVLVLVPLGAVILAMLSLRGIARSGAAGRGLALTGLGLGVLCLSLWMAQRQTYNWRLHTQAQAFALSWLELVGEGQITDAFLFTLTPRDREAARAALDAENAGGEAASSDSPAGKLRQFEQLPAIVKVSQNGPLADIRPMSRGAVTRPYGNTVGLKQDYELAPRQGPALRYTIGLECSPTDGLLDWRVVELNPAG